MKTTLIKSVLLVIAGMFTFSVQHISATTTPESKEEIHSTTDIAPEFPGGVEAMMTFFNDNIKYPAECAKDGIEGRVICRLTIDSKGNVTDAVVVRGAHKALDAEAVRVAKLFPRFTPGYKNDKPVACHYMVPMTFRLK